MQFLDETETQYTLDEISSLPPSSKVGKVFSWGLLAALIGIIVYGFVRSGWNQGITMFLYWFALNSSLTGIAAIISLGHPVTIILSMLAAPITALSPTLGVGMVAGILEITMRKPRVKDFETVTEDILHIKGWFKNRIIHALLLFFTTSVFASIGTFIAFPLLIGSLT